MFRNTHKNSLERGFPDLLHFLLILGKYLQTVTYVNIFPNFPFSVHQHPCLKEEKSEASCVCIKHETVFKRLSQQKGTERQFLSLEVPFEYFIYLAIIFFMIPFPPPSETCREKIGVCVCVHTILKFFSINDIICEISSSMSIG